jgi:hypothetical protein
VTDASYRPVLLNHYQYEPEVPVELFPGECIRILRELELLRFEGETVLIVDTPAVTIVPEQFYREGDEATLLERACSTKDTDRIFCRYLRDRKLYLLFSAGNELEGLKEDLPDSAKILHTLECLISLADQVQASDHQRGMVLAEVQHLTLQLLVIAEDVIRLSNRYALKDPSDFIYHTLNTLKQLGLDREKTPVYLSGIIHDDHELFGLVNKYVRHVKTTPYYLEGLSREEVLRFMILSEGIKCA